MNKEENSLLTVEERLLAAAEEVFMEKGFAGAKTTEIARRAGVTHAMLHYYFRTKENLFQNIFEKKIANFKGILQGFALKPDTGLEEMLRGIVEAQFDFLRSSPYIPRFILVSLWENESQMDAIMNAFVSAVKDVINSLQKTLDAETEKGNAEKISAFDLVWDLASLNVTIFITYPMSEKLGSVFYGDVEKFYKARKEENVRVILSRVLKKH